MQRQEKSEITDIDKRVRKEVVKETNNVKRQRPSQERALAKKEYPGWGRQTKCDSLYLRALAGPGSGSGFVVALGLGMACQAFKLAWPARRRAVVVVVAAFQHSNDRSRH